MPQRPYPSDLLKPDRATFPASVPDDIDDDAAITRNDWEAFSRLTTMKDHWDRPGWYPGRRAVYWMLTFPDHPDLAARAAECQELIAPLGMDHVPADGLHVTLRRLGDTRDLDGPRLADVVDETRAVVPAAFRVDAYPLAGSAGAVRFSLSPWTPLLDLCVALNGIGPTGKPLHLFRPHLCIAYNNRRRSAAPVIEAVDSARRLDPASVGVTTVSLVELWREPHQYRWKVLDEIPLTADSPG